MPRTPLCSMAPQHVNTRYAKSGPGPSWRQSFDEALLHMERRRFKVDHDVVEKCSRNDLRNVRWKRTAIMKMR